MSLAKKCSRLLLGLTVGFLAFSAQAQTQPQDSTITIARVFARLTVLFNRIIPFLALLATVVFIWGIVKYISAGDQEDKVEEARKVIAYGIIALAAMVAVWGLVSVLSSAVFDAGVEDLPGLPGPDLTPFLGPDGAGA
ncbi:MAG: hypothetical protein A3C84_00455 [Candidatus Ryanbacteria bacterium RIFCSPHIGHO2_02_FULL_48_12]|uniref:Uncharacterized protein n=1 Tax=Candidatus Ryanbacteria bacterium RIFCSPHIGHO2_01_FULL_48_27 TaxID=1802115 RepID=A0A1G2G0I2_9BACT|nr:MAG: hypothetical protein A2756_04835 [Candidatus Ryanbacteria bacterium RIFCSPHIGHO2_01_FULL_48_27]OGZ50245.1 MAG: hypothetical protein A3C84_00455 [Candidatus Ryanbacteria bacterium RIFCSPHIGHO2_02_FULL_48_12]